MSQQLYTNNAISLLENNLSTIGLQIQVIPGDGELFPQPSNPGEYFLITLEDENNTIREIVKCTNRIGDVLHIDPNGRGFENTPIYNWPVNTLVDHRITAYSLLKIEQLRGHVSSPQDDNTITPSLSKTIDISPIQFPNNISCKWLITVVDTTDKRVSMCEILAVHRGNLEPYFTMYANTGDIIQYSIDIQSDNNNLILHVENNDIHDLRINSIRLNY
jgi:hypothetical protein